jgi:CheY-like chemotaxis protein
VVNFQAVGQDVIKPEKKGESRKDAIKRVMAQAQEEYRIFFKEPKTVLEYWSALSFEVQVGKFEVAAYHLDKLLKLPEKEADDELLGIEDVEGMNTFLRLRAVKQWSKQPELEAEARKDVEVLIDRVLAALHRRLSDSERLSKFIQGLFDPVPEVRGFSLYQIKRAKQYATPLLVEALRTSKPGQQAVLKKVLLELDPDIFPPMLELFRSRDVKDAADIEFRLNLLWLAKARAEKRVIPYLWHLSSAPQYPAIVRDQAKDTLAYLLETTPDRLPPAKVALTELAEKYYHRKVRLPDTTQVADRDDPAKQLVMPAYKKWYLTEDGKIRPAPDVLKPDDARFEFGLRYAQQALELDKSYLPAQVVFLSFLLEAEFGRKPYDGQLDKLLMEKRPPALGRLLAKIDLELLTSVLERAMQERNYAVMLPLIDAVGERGEVRLAQASSGAAPALLVQLLYYPDRRVQYAAARALLKLPTSPSPVASTRVVEVLGRFLATEPAPKVLIVHAKDERATELRNAAKEAGYASDVAATVKEAVQKLHDTAEYDAILVNDAVPDNELPFVLSQLRTDSEGGLLPLLLIAPPARQAELAGVAQRTRNAFVLPNVWATKGPELKKKIEEAIKFASAPDPLRKAPEEQQPWLEYEVRRAKGQSLSNIERKQFAREALDWFAQMARGELTGYDLKPAKSTLAKALNNEDMAVQALRIIARFPGADTQQTLWGIVDNKQRANLHILAAQELNRHIQKNGLVLTTDQINVLREMERRPDLNAALRAELSILVGTVRSTPQLTGSRLLDYVPDPTPAKE